jgi:polyisoprenoid-binding protein YceI
MKPSLGLALLALTLPAHGAERAFVVDGGESRLTIAVDRAGLFSFAGHRHEVLATGIEGRILADPVDVARSSVNLVFPAAGLKVTGKGEPPEDVPKVQAKMEGAEVLDVARFAQILFRSTSVEGRESGGVWNLRVGGELTLRGVSRPLVLPLRATLAGDRLEASGQVVLRQRDFGIQPVSVAGVVKVKNELGLDYKIVARAGP